jgi:glycosyltransferase involved in cell wall biosynthesis
VHLFWARHVAIVLPMLAHARIRTLRSVFVGAYDMVADDFLVTLALRHAQVAFSHAEANRPYLEREVGPQTKIAIVRRGIPLFPLDRGLVRDPALWVTASALIREKNTEGVILAFADGRHLDPSLRLEIYGEGPDRSRLEKRIKSLGLQNAIKFRGHTPREQVFEAMQHADAFLLLSKKRSERLPNAIKEAVWAGCAIVSSNSPGIDELLPNSSIGHVIDPDDEKQVGLAVKEIVHRDRSADFERIAGARALIAERFSAQRTMGEYVACWQRAIASAGACENIAGPGAKPS